MILLTDINQSYGDTVIIDNFNMALDTDGDGKVYVLMGPSGSGKSTILRYIAGLQQPTEGSVLIDDKPVDYSMKTGGSVSMVFQQYSSFPWLRVYDNIELGLRFSGLGEVEKTRIVNKLLNEVGLHDHANKFAQYPILSGGQLQRVAIARSLAIKTPILLMDEPFGALDISTRNELQDLLLRLKTDNETSVLMTTHDPEEAVYLADTIFVLGNRPAKIIARIDIDLEGPKDKRSQLFQAYVQQIENIFQGL